VERLGKQLALTSKRGDGLVVQLGMSGQWYVRSHR
jgi:formamidopyrimidine-DNA glycosylase